ncbi:MAG: hypothetical protein IPF72_10230 [Chitinophagaceae bacterium]|nr:hypothetical protein [Chitinophagaceae bacterium]
MNKTAFVLMAFLAVAMMAGCSKEDILQQLLQTPDTATVKPVKKAANAKNSSTQSNNC